MRAFASCSSAAASIEPPNARATWGALVPRGLGARSSVGEDGLAVDAGHMLGIVEPPAEARAWNERAMELAQVAGPGGASLGRLARDNMAWARHDAGDDDGAIALFELARDELEADGGEHRARIARWSIARCVARAAM